MFKKSLYKLFFILSWFHLIYLVSFLISFHRRVLSDWTDFLLLNDIVFPTECGFTLFYKALQHTKSMFLRLFTFPIVKQSRAVGFAGIKIRLTLAPVQPMYSLPSLGGITVSPCFMYSIC